MRITQLNCPHCGSTLSFTSEVAAGAAVECLICMRAFTAENPVTAEAAPPPSSSRVDLPHEPPCPAPATAKIEETVEISSEAKPIAAKSTAAPILTAKPHAPPPTTAISEKMAPPPPAAVAKPAPRIVEPPPRDASSTPLLGTAAIVGSVLVVLFILTVGVSFGIWKIATAARGEFSVDHPKLVAKDVPKDPVVPPVADPVNQQSEETDSGGGDGLAKISDVAEEDIRVKLQDEVKQLLTRKPPSKAGPGPEVPWEPIAAVPVVQLNAGQAEQKKINAAIEKGVAYLKRTQKPDGTWHQGHPVGHASIGGLTLLECGVAAKDVSVQRSAQYVRSHSGNLDGTYELSLAILFLDRLGETRDRPIIQVLALRLMAGQNDAGGWTYKCPVLPPQDNYQLLRFLHANKRLDLLNPLGTGGTKTQSGIVLNPTRDPGKLNDPFQQFNDLVLEKGIVDSKTKTPADPPKEGLISPIPDGKKPPPAKQAPAPGPAMRPDALKPNLQKLPVVQNQGKKKNQVGRPGKGQGDNSNTQFAMLALWAARRHDVPTDHALLASYQRFMASQNPEGGWGYHFGQRNSTASMTCVGLLGQALGHGVAPEIVKMNPKNPKDVVIKPALEDANIQRGLQALARNIGEPAVEPKPGSLVMQNLYFLWSVERVAMLYDLKTIGGKDWYGWGAQILVHHQSAQGDWANSQYHGAAPSLNTCFALLFLRRSNLVLDLTDSLRLQSGIRYKD